MSYNEKMDIGNISPVLIFGLFVWSLFWKGIALWHAVKLSQRNWFIAMLVLNTVGLLEIAYLFFFAKKKFDYRTLLFWKK